MTKIPFDIKYRPEIESGKYKVLTTDGRNVRIICWDKRVHGGREDIVALVPAIQTNTECIQVYNHDGTPMSNDYTGKFKLVILTDEPELTEFEATLLSYLSDDTSGELDKETMHKCVKARAAELLELAKKELCKGCAANLEGYIKGRQDALKEKEMEENRVYKHEGPTIPAFWPPCHYGGECTNPFHDCINCPRQSVAGMNTTTGTSDLKAQNND